jgi:predicted alpha/beta superfamily hydrolase
VTFNLQAPVDRFELPHPSGQGSFKISVARHPQAEQGLIDVPVLFVMDADIEFALAAEIARFRSAAGQVPTAMVVGVGYDAPEFAEFAKLRTADLTPPMSDAGKVALGNFTSFIGEQDGGADALLTFLTDTLAPEIGRRYPEASSTDHALFGHSLGGLFTAYALLTRPEAFATFLSASPSLWWDGFAILTRLPSFADRVKTLSRKPRVFVCAGEKEQELPKKVPASMPLTLEEVQALVAASRMVDAAAEFAVALREAGLETVEHQTFVGEDHGSVVPSAMMRGLALAVPVPE